MADPHLPEHMRSVDAEEPPPFLGTWRRVYIGVVCYLAAVISIFYVFSRAFAP